MCVSIYINWIEWRKLTGSSGINCGKLDIATSDGSHETSTNIEFHIWQDGVARECDTTNGLVVDGTLNLTVVGVDDSSTGEHESGSGISDGLGTWNGHWSSGTNLERLGRELPETVGGVDGSPLHGTVELGGVNGSELVSSDCVLSEIGSEDWLGELGHGVVEEGLLLSWLDGVELGESKTDEAVGLGV